MYLARALSVGGWDTKGAVMYVPLESGSQREWKSVELIAREIRIQKSGRMMLQSIIGRLKEN